MGAFTEFCVQILIAGLRMPGPAQPKPRDFEAFLTLKSAEHDIYPAYKSQITNNSKLFLAKHYWAWNFLY